MNSRNKKIRRIIGVRHQEQTWKTFEYIPKDNFGINGPSGIHLWIYFPKDDYITGWSNWSGNINDIKYLKKQNVLWCYKVPPIKPIMVDIEISDDKPNRIILKGHKLSMNSKGQIILKKEKQ